MMVREPVVAGAFYPASAEACREDLGEMIPRQIDTSALPATIRGGIAPHAGWTYSGRVCGAVFAAIAARAQPATFVLFGASHRRIGRRAALFAEGSWQTPLGLAHVDARLAERVLAGTSLIEDDPYPHEAEHSIEVQVPFVQYLFDQARILPILVEPSGRAAEVGQAVARAVQAGGANVLYVGSTDLTHYGPGYGFLPEGAGPEGLTWAKDVNDRRLIELMRQLRAEDVVREASEHHNACGAGAIAATLAACRSAGARNGVLLSHVSSNEVARSLGQGAGQDAVGYAGMVFG
jgi:AmmeMemoRadiSam system protein B